MHSRVSEPTIRVNPYVNATVSQLCLFFDLAGERMGRPFEFIVNVSDVKDVGFVISCYD